MTMAEEKKDDDEAALFARRKGAIQTTWVAVGDSLGIEATRLFYERLFDQHPEVKPMFSDPDDMEEQAAKLLKTISVAVESLSDIATLVPILQDLGKKHAEEWNVQRNHYDAVGECLIWTLKTGLGDSWTEDVADAWSWVYGVIAKTMGDAGQEVLDSKSLNKTVEIEEQATDMSSLATAVEKTADYSTLPSIRSLIRSGVTSRDEIKLRPESSALLVIDIQKELSTVDINSPHIEYAKIAFPRMIENTSKLLAAMRTNRSRLEPKQIGNEVIFTYIEALTDDSRDVSLDYKLSGAFLANLPGPSNPAQFVQGVEPIPGKDIRMPKTSCSVFMSTNIDYVLRNLNVEQLIICGQLTDQCVESACRDAADRGYLVTVAKDACAAQCTKDHLKGMKGMKGFSRQLTTDEILKELTT
mmetsp:Transcript_4964/g.10568  ORF Transcript_4964/g.10568 Transcript_4964/m.10568 type:complete len:414 (+) Transcript_4964:76-1317(+)